MSGYGCHISGNFMGALSYADDITLLCPSLRGLNAMLQYAPSMQIILILHLTIRKLFVLNLVLNLMAMSMRS